MAKEALPGTKRGGTVQYPGERAIQAKSNFLSDAFLAVAFNGISGDYAEFGSWGGVTFSFAYQQIGAYDVPRHLWAFDSFAGLPPTDDQRDAHPAWGPGSMSMSVQRFHKVLADRGVEADAYTVVPGFYSESLPQLGAHGPPTDIALAYVDCDLYSSTVSVLEFLAPRLKHGMIVAFDDYFCWTADSISGERAALCEFCDARPEWRFHRYRDFGWAGCAFVVEDAEVGPLVSP